MAVTCYVRVCGRPRAFVTALATARRISWTVPAGAAERLSATAAGRAIVAGMLYADPTQCPPGAVTACLRSLRESLGFDAMLRAGRAHGLFSGQIPGTPITIVWGTVDRVLLLRQARRAIAMLPQAQLIWLPGCGHVPMNDAPELVADVIIQATGPDIAVRRADVDTAASYAQRNASAEHAAVDSDPGRRWLWRRRHVSRTRQEPPR